MDLNKIVVSKKWKINDTTYKHLCGYLNNDTIQPLRVILPQMDGYIKYFDNGGKNMSFVTDDEKIYEKYNKIWEVVRNLLTQKGDTINENERELSIFRGFFFYLQKNHLVYDCKVGSFIFNNKKISKW